MSLLLKMIAATRIRRQERALNLWALHTLDTRTMLERASASARLATTLRERQLAAILSLLLKRESAYKLRAWRSWHAAAIGLRQRETRRLHEKDKTAMRHNMLMRMCCQLMADSSMRVLHGAWVRWTHHARDHREHHAALHAKATLDAKHALHVTSVLMGAILNRDGRLKLMAFRSWVGKTDAMRRAELLTKHADQLDGLNKELLDHVQKRMRAWLTLLVNGALRRCHQAWLQWMLTVEEGRRAAAMKAAEEQMHQHRVLAWLKAIFAKHGNMAKLAGWRSWRIFVDRAREAEMVARHEKSVFEIEAAHRAEKFRSWVNLLINRDTRKVHQAWLQWHIVVREARRLQREAEHAAEVVAHREAHVKTSVITLLNKRGLRAKLASFRTWLQIAFGARFEAMRKEHKDHLENMALMHDTAIMRSFLARWSQKELRWLHTAVKVWHVFVLADREAQRIREHAA